MGTRKMVLMGRTSERKMGTRRKEGVLRSGRKCRSSRRAKIQMRTRATRAKRSEPIDEAAMTAGRHGRSTEGKSKSL
jgi:hypothetical protein